MELTVDGTSRRAIALVPQGDEPMPLLIYFHGLRSSPEFAIADAELEAVAVRESAVVAVPLGIAQSWNAGDCCGIAARDVVDDVGFVSALVKEIDARWAIDADRVYATGYSNGAVMADRVGCELPNRFAAVAVVSGTASGPCRPATPISILIMHGTHDPTFPYAEAEVNAARWRGLLACQGDPDNLEVGASATAVDYPACAEGATLRFITVDNGAHAWFPAPDATDAVWSFFASLGRP
ncbi:MAG: hypothetical protein M3406_03855 [Chloroflexota bacterium]|nr:hypothetical protein [Chloroflexota bacterium]